MTTLYLAENRALRAQHPRQHLLSIKSSWGLPRDTNTGSLKPGLNVGPFLFLVPSLVVEV
jgi:hypothetical protein